MTHDQARIAAVMDAIDRPMIYVGPLTAFPSRDEHLHWKATAVLNALADTDLTHPAAR